MTSAIQPPSESVHADGVTARIPLGWHAYTAEGALLAVRESASFRALPATAVVTAEPLDAHDDVVEWFRACRADLDRSSRHLEVVELVEAEVAGRRARRLVATHAVVGVGGVVLDQWLVPAGSRGIVLSCTAPALAYDLFADAFAGLAATVTIEEPM